MEHRLIQERPLCLPRTIYDEMLRHAWAEAPLEACGLLGGREGRPERFFPTPNAEKSPVRYAIAPRDLLRVMREIEGAGMELVAIFHSHPATQAYPSATDIRLAFWPDAVYAILSLADPAAPLLRAFFIRDGKVQEVPVVIE